jgi:putative hydrolase of the HAD superfamily
MYVSSNLETGKEHRVDRRGLRIQAVTFDFWGTLYEHREAEPVRMALLRQKVRVDGDLQQAYDHVHQLAHHYWRVEQRSLPTAERVDTMLDVLGVSAPPPVRKELITGFEEALLQMSPAPVPGVRCLLQALQELGIPMGLISDTGITPGRVLRAVMARDGLLSFFAHCTFSDEVGRAKPHPLPFQHTLEALGVEAPSATHIGDLPETDIVGAKGVGMRAVLFTGVTGLREGSEQADALLASYNDLEAVLRALDWD